MIKFTNEEKRRAISHGRISEILSKPEYSVFLANEESKRDFINNLDFDGFMSILVGLNSELVLRNKKERKLPSTRMVVKSGFLGRIHSSPYPEDMQELYKEVFLELKRLNSQNYSLKNIGIFLSTAINAIHGFNDGNGRLSRLIYFLLSDDTEIMANLEKIVAENGKDYYDFTTIFIENDLFKLQMSELDKKNGDIFNSEIPKIYFPPGTADHISDLRKELDLQGDDGGIFLLDAISENDDAIPVALSVFILNYFPDKKDLLLQKEMFGNRQIISIRMDEILKLLSSKENRDKFNECFRMVKKQSVLDFISIFKEGNKYTTQNGELLGSYFLRKNIDEINRKVIIRIMAEKSRLDEIQKLERETQILSQVAIQFENSNQPPMIKNRGEVNRIFELYEEAKFFYEAGKREARIPEGVLLKKFLDLIIPNNIFSIAELQKVIDDDFDLRKIITLHLKKMAGIINVLEYLIESNSFASMLTTTRNLELDTNSPEQMVEFLTMSVYFVTKSGITLRLRLYDVFLGNSEDFIKEPMEQIFFTEISGANKLKVDMPDVKQFDGLIPFKGERIYEVKTEGFAPNSDADLYKGVKTLEKDGRFFVDLSNVEIEHTGYYVQNSVALSF